MKLQKMKAIHHILHTMKDNSITIPEIIAVRCGEDPDTFEVV